ncbi:G-protein coupled receptor GRL101-like [Babylonia areolata]|uniref:G-protein coupled receptor GRL101-like n=1 Tax=Babylonia areolata TaxID=304850 RepID=UPI003FD591F5
MLTVGEVFGVTFLKTLAHLQAAGICMGSHVSIAVVADQLLYGVYVHVENTWVNSEVCKVSGFLSLLSSEVSVLTVWLITVRHVVILSCPARWCSRPTNRSTAAQGTLTWLAGISLSLIPFLPGLSHWGLQGQSGLCRLALFSHYSPHRQFTWFTVLVVVNFIFSSMTLAGLVVTSRRTPKYRLALEPARRPVYSSVQLMMKVASTDAVCWILFGLVTVLVVSGSVAGADRLHGALVVFALPFNSALNPLLSLWTVAMQRRRQAREGKLFAVLKARLACQKKVS